MTNKLILAGLACLLALAAAGPVMAGEARASGNVPVRDGPGSRYAIIDHLENGAYYEVIRCRYRGTWCLVGDDGDTLGWVRASYLVGSGAKVEATPFEPLVNPFFFEKKKPL